MDEVGLPMGRIARRDRAVETPAQAFGVTAPSPRSANWHGQAWLDPIYRVFGHLTGVLWNSGLTRVAGRITALEKALQKLFVALEPGIDTRISAAIMPLAERVDALERRLNAVMLVQKETNEHLQTTASTGVEAVKSAVARIEELRQDMHAEIARLDAVVAELPPQWRVELQDTLDTLRTKPDAANALLHGVEAFSASIARTIEGVD
jgi:hypothetical protein